MYDWCNEAADEIERLREALRDLLDEQNGPPLVRRADEWQAAVDQARAVLGEVKPLEDRWDNE
jgi:hypothetical protein